MGITTDNLLNQLSSMNTLSELQNFTENTETAGFKLNFYEYLADLIQTSPLSLSELIRKSGIQRNYAYQIINGVKRPGRDKVLALCLALSLPLEETQRALTIAEENVLYPKNKRDSIIIFCINQEKSVQETNDLPYELNEEPIQ